MMKLTTFPNPYPDELLYSVIARYHVRLGYQNPKDTLEDLFGSRTAAATYDFPCRLQELCNRLPASSKFTPGALIDNFTLLPYYQRFLPPERLAEVKEKMALSNSGGTIHTTLGVIAQGNQKLENLRYCRECLREDQALFGEGFWHRSHQLPGIRACHKHHISLVESQVKLASRLNRHESFALEQIASHDDPKSLKSRDVSGTDIWLAEKAHWLLGCNAKPLGLDSLKERYLGVLIKRGLACPMGRMRRDDFLDGFASYYDNGFLAEMGCEFNAKSNGCWPLVLIQKATKSSSPLRHMLIMKFLEEEPEKFLADIFEGYKPFGDGPFPCLNPACEHFRKSVVLEMEITRNSKTGRPVGNFECECGFAYARTGPDTCLEDRFKRTRVIKMGPIWEQELLRLDADPTVGLLQKSRWLGVDPNTIYSYLDKLKGVNTRRKSHGSVNKNTKRDDYRANVLQSVMENPEMGRTKLRSFINREYSWLFRYDREWLFENLPKPMRPPGQRGLVVDWGKRDEEWSQKAQGAIDELVSQVDKMKRVTFGQIGRKIGRLTVLKNNLHKLPLTNSAIEGHVETIEDFQLRRVRATAKKLIDEGETLKEWKLVKFAALRPNYSSAVREEIHRQIEQSAI